MKTTEEGDSSHSGILTLNIFERLNVFQNHPVDNNYIKEHFVYDTKIGRVGTQ